MSLSKALIFSQLCIIASATKSSIRGGNQPRELNTRIIGGDEAIEDRYPYAVSLQDSIGHFCGGSLIAKDVVLSAAHCSQNGRGYNAVIGRHNLLTDTDGYDVAVKAEISHPSYDSTTTNNDFMILILNQAVGDEVDLVKVSRDIIPVDTLVTVMGWGDTDPSDSISTPSPKLIETEVKVISKSVCEQSSGTIGGTEIMPGWLFGGYQTNYQNKISENMVCAKDYGEDSCQGDSGGPLVIRQNLGDDVQVGVVSWGIGCAHVSFPGVYARVSAQYDWIRTIVCNGSSEPPSYFEC